MSHIVSFLQDDKFTCPLFSLNGLTLVLSYTSVVPAGVATSVITSQSMVLSGGGASVSVITPRMLERLFFTFSEVSDEPSTCNRNQKLSLKKKWKGVFPVPCVCNKHAYSQLALDSIGGGDNGASSVMLHHVGEFC